jgi:TRAP-type mannitol/chloroaromatic compound transport system permease small subunit
MHRVCAGKRAASKSIWEIGDGSWQLGEEAIKGSVLFSFQIKFILFLGFNFQFLLGLTPLKIKRLQQNAAARGFQLLCTS